MSTARQPNSLDIASPAAMLTTQLISRLSHSGIYSYVVDGNSSVDHNQVLEGSITDLYGDYTRPKTPQGVIAIRFFVLRQSSDGTSVLHDKVYRAVQPAKDQKPEGLVEAWGAAYHRIIEELTQDLRVINASPAAQAGTR